MSNMFQPVAAALVMAAAVSSPAWAIDCAKAAGPVDKLICNDGALSESDAALNEAFQAALSKAPDDGVRDALRESQRRWLAARDERLSGLIDNPDEGDGKTPRELAASMIEARTGALGVEEGREGLNFIEAAEQQTAFAAQFSGGPFGGFTTRCDMLPPDQVYACFATSSYQNGDRVCSIETYWATGSVYVQRYVADVVDGAPKVVASCSFNGNDNNCPGSIDEEARWNVEPKQRPDLYASQSLPKIDIDVDNRDEYRWLTTCLTDKGFPLADPKSSGE